MPTTPPQIEPDLSRPEPGVPAPSGSAPVTFVPHDASGAVGSDPVKIQAGRYGTLEAHEIVSLLGTLEDERARGRFRESVYISVFVWLLIAWVVLYGPRYLWHAPRLIMPADALRQRELTQLNAPILSHAPVVRPQPKLDNHTLEKLREMTRTAPSPSPSPAPSPSPIPDAPAPTMPPPSNAPTAVPTHPAPVVADAPTPQPNTKPSFKPGGTAGDNIKSVVNDVAHDHSAHPDIPRSGGPSHPLGGGMEVLTDLHGVDINAYLRQIYNSTFRAWIPLLPEEINPPLSKRGQTWIRFTINPDGTIKAMHLDDSTHDDALNRAAWGSIVSQGQFPPLPPQLKSPELELRYRYDVNIQPQ